MPSLDSVAQQENWDVVDDGETRDRMNGENDNIESIAPPPHPPHPTVLPATNVREKYRTFARTLPSNLTSHGKIASK